MADPVGHLWVNGLVASRDKEPYVQLSNENGIFAQLSMAMARKVAMDILQMSARTEADAMIHKFFSATGMPENAGAAMMIDFREYRARLDQEEVKGSFDEPT